MSEQLPHQHDELVAFDSERGCLHLRARVPPRSGTVLRFVLPGAEGTASPHRAEDLTLQGLAEASHEVLDPYAYGVVVDAATRTALLAWLGWSRNATLPQTQPSDDLAQLLHPSSHIADAPELEAAPEPSFDVDSVLMELDLAPPHEEGALELAGHTMHLAEVALDDDELLLFDGPAPLVSGAENLSLRGTSMSPENPVRLDVAVKAGLGMLDVVLPVLPPKADVIPGSLSADAVTFQPFQDDDATVAVPAVAMTALDFEFESRPESIEHTSALGPESPQPREASGLADAGVGYSQLRRAQEGQPKSHKAGVEERPVEQRPPSPVATPLQQLLAPLPGWPPGRRPVRR